MHQPLPVAVGYHVRAEAEALLGLFQGLPHEGGVHEAEPGGGRVDHVRVQPVRQRRRQGGRQGSPE